MDERVQERKFQDIALDWFFDQWLFKPGHPVFDVQSNWDPARKVVTLKVAQVQDYSRGIPAFRVPVEVGIATAKGKTTSTVWVCEKEQSFEFPSETRPLMVGFDEGNVLIKELNFPKGIEELLYRHPKIREAAVVGIPDPLWGESVKAYVV
jgi:aminopeptidase N